MVVLNETIGNTKYEKEENRFLLTVKLGTAMVDFQLKPEVKVGKILHTNS